jgi:ribonucleoside-diphosphate reductase alpha subunit
LSSISLPEFVNDTTNQFDYDALEKVTRQVVINMNKMIDNNFYPVPEARVSNMRHRPLGIGVQGLANLFFRLGISFESDNAREMNCKIFETIYYAALRASMELAKIDGAYSTFEGSPFSKGILQFDYASDEIKQRILSDRYDWDQLKSDIKTFGTRNSLLTACMPTASTSQILNNFESFEPITYNMFTRNTKAGTFSVINRYLVTELQRNNKLNLSELKSTYGSIQQMTDLPQDIRDLYKSVYEIPQKTLVDLSADRQWFIDQSQSLNIYFENPTISKLTSMLFYGWEAGLKTGMYYLRSEPISQAAQVTVKPKINTKEEILACSINNKENCEACSG